MGGGGGGVNWSETGEEGVRERTVQLGEEALTLRWREAGLQQQHT